MIYKWKVYNLDAQKESTAIFPYTDRNIVIGDFLVDDELCEVYVESIEGDVAIVKYAKDYLKWKKFYEWATGKLGIDENTLQQKDK